MFFIEGISAFGTRYLVSTSGTTIPNIYIICVNFLVKIDYKVFENILRNPVCKINFGQYSLCQRAIICWQEGTVMITNLYPVTQNLACGMLCAQCCTYQVLMIFTLYKNFLSFSVYNIYVQIFSSTPTRPGFSRCL